MITRKRKTFLLGLLGAATAAGMVLGATGVISSAVGEPIEANAEGDTFTDTITSNELGAEKESYVDWTYSSSNNVTYVSNSAKSITNGNSIQLRSKNNSGIVIKNTVTDFFVSSITIDFHKGTSNGKTVDIYGSHSPITSTQSLYNSSLDKIGTIEYNSSLTSWSLELTDVEYEYVGIRSTDGAIYLSSIDFTFSRSMSSLNIVDLDVSGTYKTEYYDGETLDLDGLVVKGVDEEGNPYDVAYTTEPSEGSILKTGDEVYVVYSDTLKKKVENITVSDRTLASIEVKKLPNKTSYILGEKLDVTGIVVNGIYDLGTPADVTKDCVFTPETFDTLGEQTITVTHTPTGKTTTFAVQVNSKRATSLSISNPTKMFMENDKFTFGSGTITVKWNDSSTNVVAMDDPDLRIELVDSIDARPGTGDPIDFDYVMKGSDTHRFVLVSYLDASNKYQITVHSTIDYSHGCFYPVSSLSEIGVSDHILLVYKNADGKLFSIGGVETKYASAKEITEYYDEKRDLINLKDSSILSIELLEGYTDETYLLHLQSINSLFQYSGSDNEVYTESDSQKADENNSWKFTTSVVDGVVEFKIQNAAVTGRYLQYNASSPRFACYKGTQQDLLIYKFEDNSTVVSDFADTYMHMSDYNDNENKCYGVDGYYAKAKEALVKLTDEQIELFKTDSEFADAHARYLAWAAANGDSSPYSGEYVSPAMSIHSSDGLTDIAVISALAVAGIAAAGAFVFLRRKKGA